MIVRVFLFETHTFYDTYSLRTVDSIKLELSRMEFSALLLAEILFWSSIFKLKVIASSRMAYFVRHRPRRQLHAGATPDVKVAHHRFTDQKTLGPPKSSRSLMSDVVIGLPIVDLTCNLCRRHVCQHRMPISLFIKFFVT